MYRKAKFRFTNDCLDAKFLENKFTHIKVYVNVPKKRKHQLSIQIAAILIG